VNILQKDLIQLQSRTGVPRDWVIFVVFAPEKEILLRLVMKSEVSCEQFRY